MYPMPYRWTAGLALTTLLCVSCGTNDSLHLAAVPLQPDLVVVHGSGTNDPDPAMAGLDFDFTATIQNKGGTSAPGFGVDLFHGSTKIAHSFVSGGLAASQAIPFTVHNIHTHHGHSGSMHLTMIVDPSGSIDESDETNNSASFTVSVSETAVASLYQGAPGSLSE